MPDYICSSDFSSLDKVIISCPQLASKKTAAAPTVAPKCGLVDWATMAVSKTSEIANKQPIITYDGYLMSETSIRVLNVENLTKDDKCTYIVRAKCDGPGFRVRDITGTTGAQNAEIHYYEYSYATPLWSRDVINGLVSGPNTECIA